MNYALLGFVLVGKDVGEDGAADAMPCTTDGARDYCHRIGSHEEGHGEVCAQSGILHAYFDGESALLGNGEVAEATYGITEDVSDGVVTEDHSEGEHEEKESVLYERVVNGSDDSTDDAGKGYNRDSGHATLNLTEYFLFTQPHIQEEADGDRYDSDYQNLFEHTDSIPIDTTPRILPLLIFWPFGR